MFKHLILCRQATKQHIATTMQALRAKPLNERPTEATDSIPLKRHKPLTCHCLDNEVTDQRQRGSADNEWWLKKYIYVITGKNFRNHNDLRSSMKRQIDIKKAFRGRGESHMKVSGTLVSDYCREDKLLGRNMEAF